MSLPIRVSEWSRVQCHELSDEIRRKVNSAVEGWRVQNRLSAAPLFFSGAEGKHLCARHYVGVVEINDVLIEIYPKLDASLIEASAVEPLPATAKVDSVMRSLLWMLEVAEYRDLADTETAHLEEAPTSFFDLFAYLLGKTLLPELERGVAHAYLPFEGNLRSVRGRIALVEQVTRNWNRFDHLRCSWDEFTANTALNRLFKCAGRFLSEHVNYSQAALLLLNCETLLSDVDDVSVSIALRDTADIRFDRSIGRFKTAFDLARNLLSGIGHDLGAGKTETFVFLIDMNRVFEKYVHAVLESHFGVAVEEQKSVGELLQTTPGSIAQVADYVWGGPSQWWIGDAKYKHLTKGHDHALKFGEIKDEEGVDDLAPVAGRVLNASDIRQLTVYAELFRLRTGLAKPPAIILFYPFVGSESRCVADYVTAWNGSQFWLVPVLVKEQRFPAEAIRLYSMEKG